MFAELTIHPLDEGVRLTDALAYTVDLIAESGLEYEVTPDGTRIEGDSVAVWELLRRCHESIPEEYGRVVTEVRIDFSGKRQHDCHASRKERLAPVISTPHPLLEQDPDGVLDPTYPCACHGVGCVTCLGEACP